MAKKILKLSIFLPFLFLVAYAFASGQYMFTNFTAGELTRKLDSRLDYEKFFNGARTLENMIVYPQGGVAKRPGFKYIAKTKYADKESRLIPFVYSDEQAYMLEFGHAYIRFYMDGGQIVIDGSDLISNGDFSGVTDWETTSGSTPHQSGTTYQGASYSCVVGQDEEIYHPIATCTDPDNDQNVTTGWTATTAVLTSEAGGVTGNRLKVVTGVLGGHAYANFAVEAGKIYNLKVKAGADVGDDYKVRVYINGGNDYDSGFIAGAGAGNWDTIDIIFTASADDATAQLILEANVSDTTYFDNVELTRFADSDEGLQQYISGLTPFESYELSWYALEGFSGATQYEYEYAVLDAVSGTTIESGTTETDTGIWTEQKRVTFDLPVDCTGVTVQFTVNISGVTFYLDTVQLVHTGQSYEVTTSFTEDDLSLIKYTQSADVLYLVHPDYAPQKLMRSGHTDWTLQDVNFQPGALGEEGHELIADLILNQATVSGVSISGVSAHSTAAVFNTADEGRYITCGGGRALISGVTDASHIQVTIADAFSSVTCYQTEWTVEGSPVKELRCYPEHFSRKGQEVYFSYPGAYIWRAADVGKYVVFEGGVVRITAVMILSGVGYLQAWGEIVEPLDENRPTGGAAYTYHWTLESEVWNSTNGYPTCVEFFEERLCFAGSSEYPQTIWGSVSGDYENFSPGPDDADSFSFTIASDQVNIIQWIKNLKRLLIGTTGGEWWMSGSDSLIPVTPANKTIRRESTFGSQNINPIVIDNSVLFVQKPGKKIRRYSYSYTEDAYKGQDLLILAEHLTDNYAITEIAYQQSPYQTLWALRADGDLLGLTSVPEQEVFAWHRHETDGDFESIAVIPGDDRDELWAITERWINDVRYRFIEQMQTDEWQYTWEERQLLLGNTPFHPTANCTDPDNDQATTVGWAVSGSVISDEPGGVTGNRLKVHATLGIGGAKAVDISMKSGSYRFKVKAGADVGDDYRIKLLSPTYGTIYDSGSIAGSGAGSWDTIDVIVYPSTQTDWRIFLYAWGAGQNAYFDNVSLYEYEETNQTEIDNSDGFFVDCGLTYNDSFDISGVTGVSGTTPYWPGNMIITLTETHDIETGDTVYIKGVEGIIFLNNREWAVASVGGVTIEVTNTLFGTLNTYEQGGTVQKYTNSVTGAEHLSGVTVNILADGNVLDDQQVTSSGGLSFSEYYRVIHAGLPYDSILETLDMPAYLGKVKRVPYIYPRFYRTSYAQFGPNEDTLLAVKFDSGTTPFTGKRKLTFQGGQKREQTVMFYSDQPLPMGISGILLDYE